MVWLLDIFILAGIWSVIPLLGALCSVYYLFTIGLALWMKTPPHKGMADKLARDKAAQAANDKHYRELEEKKELAKANKAWQDSSHERLSIPALLGVLLTLVLIAWGLKNV